MFYKENLKEIFPMLNAKVAEQDLIYLDNAATTLRPKKVVDAITRYYEQENANIHRGIHHYSELSTNRYEESRDAICEFLHAREREEIIFTRGTTDALNLLAFSLGEYVLKEGDEIIISGMEHHSNIVPWQMLCERKNATLKVINVLADGTLDLEHYQSLLNEKTKIVSAVHISNSLGTVNPIDKMIRMAHSVDAYFVVDAAQSVAHQKIDVQELHCDFLVFSAHKMYGPTGIGALYGKREHLTRMPPYQGGGNMIDKVSFEKTTYNILPHKFEAGTPPIASGIAFKDAIDLLNDFGMNNIHQHEQELVDYGLKKLKEIPGLRLIGDAPERTCVFSFVLEGVHPQDVATLLNKVGIAIRTGHHCTQPLMKFFEVPGTCRASLALYNDKSDIDALVNGIRKVQSLFL